MNMNKIKRTKQSLMESSILIPKEKIFIAVQTLIYKKIQSWNNLFQISSKEPNLVKKLTNILPNRYQSSFQLGMRQCLVKLRTRRCGRW